MFGKGDRMVTLVYEVTKHFPTDERYGLTSQIRRCAVSIPANIAEGAARQTDKEFHQVLSIAQGSSSELVTEFLIAKNLGYVNEETYDRLYSEINTIARMIVGLSKALRSRI